MGEPYVGNLHNSEMEWTHGELKYLSSHGKEIN